MNASINFWFEVVKDLDALGQHGAGVAGFCRKALRAAESYQWHTENGEDEHSVSNAQGILAAAEAAAWGAAASFTPPKLPPTFAEEYLGRLRRFPADRLREVRSRTGEAVYSEGDSNNISFIIRGTREGFTIHSGVVKSILGAYPAKDQSAIKWRSGTSRTGLIYYWAAPITREALRALRLEARARQGISFLNLDPFEPLHPEVRAAWKAAHTTWTFPV